MDLTLHVESFRQVSDLDQWRDATLERNVASKHVRCPLTDPFAVGVHAAGQMLGGQNRDAQLRG